MIEAGAVSWLLERSNPSARYLALTKLLGRQASDPDVQGARAEIAGWGPAKAILDAQWPEGYWMQPGRGYSPKHKATMWQIIFLGALATPRSGAIDRACSYVLEHGRLPDGRFTAYKSPRGAVACLNGNLLRAFAQLEYEDPRLQESVDALAGMVLRDRFCCSFRTSPPSRRQAEGQPCVSGAVRALAAFAEVPPAERSTAVGMAIEAGIDFLFDAGLVDVAEAGGAARSSVWQRFGFPPADEADLLEALNALSRFGIGNEPRIERARDVVRQKRQAPGRWLLERTPKNTWADFGQVGKPNRWVTLQALRALKGSNPNEDRESVGHPR